MKGFSLFFDFVKRFFSKMDVGASILADYFSFEGMISGIRGFLAMIFYSFFFYILVKFITDVSSFLSLIISILKTFFNDFNNISKNQNPELHFIVYFLKSTGILPALNFCLNVFIPYFLFIFYLLFFKHFIRSTYYFKDFIKPFSYNSGKIDNKPNVSKSRLSEVVVNFFKFKG